MPPADSLLTILLLGLIVVIGIAGIVVLVVLRSFRRHGDQKLSTSKRKSGSDHGYTDVWSESARRASMEDDREDRP